MYWPLFVCFISLFYPNVTCKRRDIPEPFYNRSDTIAGETVVFRVVHGTQAKLGEIPYLIAFMQPSSKGSVYMAFCGGTIIGPSKIVTAAHCVVEDYPQSSCLKGKTYNFKHVFVRAGSISSVNYPYESGQWRKPTVGFYPTTYFFPKDDIAFVFTDSPFKFNEYVDYIPFASRSMQYTGVCITSGYGQTGFGLYPEKLLYAWLEVISPKLCNYIHHRDMSKYICTSDLISDVDRGDSGGPLACRNTGDPKEGDKGILVGIVSGKVMALRSGTFFTRVSSFADFVGGSSHLKLTVSLYILSLLNTILINGALSLF